MATLQRKLLEPPAAAGGAAGAGAEAGAEATSVVKKLFGIELLKRLKCEETGAGPSEAGRAARSAAGSAWSQPRAQAPIKPSHGSHSRR